MDEPLLVVQQTQPDFYLVTDQRKLNQFLPIARGIYYLPHTGGDGAHLFGSFHKHQQQQSQQVNLLSINQGASLHPSDHDLQQYRFDHSSLR